MWFEAGFAVVARHTSLRMSRTSRSTPTTRPRSSRSSPPLRPQCWPSPTVRTRTWTTSIRSWAPPTAEELDRLAVLSARPENRAYFFDRLENPNWVRDLAQRGFFANPPGPVPAGEPGYVRFPPWPEGRYLVRVAAEAPAAVAS